MEKETMAKIAGKRSIIAVVGGVLVGAAILLFVTSMVINSLKGSTYPRTGHNGWTGIAGSTTASWGTWNATARADWNTSNASMDQLKTFLTVCAVLMGILGIVLIGITIIGTIGGSFGGSKGGGSFEE
jgi:hypothetical protein